MNIQETAVNGVSEFVTEIQQLEQRHIAQWFYRGHSNFAYKVDPSMFRLDTEGSFASWEEIEQYMISTFIC